jgi:hypothetical protein
VLVAQVEFQMQLGLLGITPFFLPHHQEHTQVILWLMVVVMEDAKFLAV